MRAYEFLAEVAANRIVKNRIKLPKTFDAALPGTHRVAGTADRHYDLARIMQYVAASDGRTLPRISQQSWAGRNNTAHPYTRCEADMLVHAYMLADVEWDDALHPNSDNLSIELPDTNKNSPLQPFNGY